MSTLGQTNYYVTYNNGIPTYTTNPNAGNTPYGYTPITQAQYIAGIQGQISTMQTQLQNGLPAGYTGATPSAGAIAQLQSQLASAQNGTGVNAPGYVDPVMANFDPNAPTPSQQYETPSYQALIASQQAGSTAVPRSSGGTDYFPTGSAAASQAQNGGIDPTGQNVLATSVTAPGAQPISSAGLNTMSTIGGGSGATPPTVALQPGSTNTAAVKQLQDYLVSQGYMTQVQVDTGYGTYGPQTTAAVSAMQKALNVNAGGNAGDYGPLTMSAISSQGGGSTSSSGVTPNPNGTVAEQIAAGNIYDTQTGKLLSSESSSTDTSGSSTATGKTYPTTGNANLDSLQQGLSNYISGSLSSGFTINPALSITPDTVAQFITETASQLEPRLQQSLSQEITGVNTALGAAVTNYLAQQGQTVQDFQQTLGTTRNSAGQSGMYMGGGENALEQGLLNSSQRSLNSLDATTQANIGSQLQAGGTAVGQGFAGTSSNGANVPGVSGNANSFNIPSLYGVNLSLGAGNSVFSGGSSTGNALNFNYNPSMYQYGTIPGQFSTDFTNLLNTTAQNYQQGQIATGATNQPSVTSSSGLTL